MFFVITSIFGFFIQSALECFSGCYVVLCRRMARKKKNVLEDSTQTSMRAE
jgi:hypothetical protein